MGVLIRVHCNIYIYLLYIAGEWGSAEWGTLVPPGLPGGPNCIRGPGGCSKQCRFRPMRARQSYEREERLVFLLLRGVTGHGMR